MTDFSQTLSETVGSEEGRRLGSAGSGLTFRQAAAQILGSDDFTLSREGVLQNMEGIANVQFAAVQDITWDTTTDWDNATDEKSVRHVSHSGLKSAGDGTIELGYKVVDETGQGSLVAYIPLDEDSGQASDVTGNLPDSSSNSGTQGDIGIGDTTSYDYNSDMTDWGDLSQTDVDYITISLWARPRYDMSDYAKIITNGNHNSMGWRIDAEGGGTQQIGFVSSINGNTQSAKDDTTSRSGWHHFCATYDGSTVRFYVDGVETGSTSASGTIDSTTGPFRIAADDNNDEYFDGNVDEVRLYNVGLNSTQVQALADVGSSGYLTTSTKSMGSPAQPDLANLSYSLNNHSITLDVIGSPGTASEEIVSQTLDGASSYALSWANSHTDFRVKINLSTSDPTVTPTFSGVTLTT